MTVLKLRENGEAFPKKIRLRSNLLVNIRPSPGIQNGNNVGIDSMSRSFMAAFLRSIVQRRYQKQATLGKVTKFLQPMIVQH
ncbi:hypothetical protein F8388_021900 [Cannabis sativa]|uniref:Uncharacterized protein n=1 Tax=Cannabis sativa TaxID=3483 RepID=A0A7J6ELL0_CANSA|nr:hypothetical protein F8388_021900 [Cannabis sativa]